MNADAVLFSAVGDPKFDNDPTAKVRPEQGLLAMRKKLGLFANIRPVETFDCLIHKSPLKDELVRGADFICIRELTGGMYFGEKYQDDEKAYDTNAYTRPEIERILKVAYEYAMRRRKHLTVVDKANVLASSRLWRQVAKEMAPQYPEVVTDYMFVDNAAMRMIQDPRFFDVMVTENTFGDILTDEGSCITGSMGLLPSASTGEHTPVFEPIHGSWPQAKGLNIANPLAVGPFPAFLFGFFNLRGGGAPNPKGRNPSLDANVRTPEIKWKAASATAPSKWASGLWITLKRLDFFIFYNFNQGEECLGTNSGVPLFLFCLPVPKLPACAGRRTAVPATADCRAERVGVLCGKYLSTCRRVPRVFSAKYAGGLRPPFVRLRPFVGLVVA